jgi:hypothetical protein
MLIPFKYYLHDSSYLDEDTETGDVTILSAK